MRENGYKQVVKYSAIWDLVFTAGFALPIIAGIKLDLLRNIHDHFALSGVFPEFELIHLFFVNLTGSLVIVWSLLRIRHPMALYGLYDSLARFLFALAMTYAFIVGEGTMIILFMLIPEIIWGVIQLIGYQKYRSSFA